MRILRDLLLWSEKYFSESHVAKLNIHQFSHYLLVSTPVHSGQYQLLRVVWDPSPEISPVCSTQLASYLLESQEERLPETPERRAFLAKDLDLHPYRKPTRSKSIYFSR